MRSKGERLRSKLQEALGHNPHVKEVRGLGLICGVQLDVVRALPGMIHKSVDAIVELACPVKPCLCTAKQLRSSRLLLSAVRHVQVSLYV